MYIEVKVELASEPCKEQASTSGSIVIFRNESLKLTYRRSSSISFSGSGHSLQNNHHHDTCSTIGNDTACLCTKCHARTTSCKLCSECELFQKQEAIKRWKKLASLTITVGWWLVFVKDAKSALVDDDNTSILLKCSVNGNEGNSPQSDHVIDITPDIDSKTPPNNEVNPDSSICARATRSVLVSHHIIIETTVKHVFSWFFIKWTLRVLNVVIEAFQATVTQENGQKRISDTLYMKLTVLTSFTCLVIALVEIIGESKCQRNGYNCWFHYPERRLLYVGVVSLMIQFLINLITLTVKKRFVKFDSVLLMLSFGHLVAGLADPGE